MAKIDAYKALEMLTDWSLCKRPLPHNPDDILTAKNIVLKALKGKPLYTASPEGAVSVVECEKCGEKCAPEELDIPCHLRAADLRDDHDRCCCECGDHFDGSLEDDYCAKCYALLPEVDFNG